MIVKAVSAIILLLLKHLKVNHIYQVIPEDGPFRSSRSQFFSILV